MLAARNGKFYLLTLGCPKNEVDSDHLASILMGAGWLRAGAPREADTLLVNTCSFIQPAVEEAIEAILDIADLKEGGARNLVVAGCLVSRYGKAKLAELLPEVDLFIDFADYPRLPTLMDARKGDGPGEVRRHYASTLRKGYVFIKLSEGCRRRCSFCTIPRIRGALASRSWEDIRDESLFFLGKGAREIVFIAQDTTSYGMDLYGKPSLPLLIDRLTELDGGYGLRIMYLHPEGIDSRILASMANPKVYPYMDIPFQHADSGVLKAMGRRGSRGSHRRLLSQIRDTLGESAIRATFMVGFPGEEDASFAVLEDFIAEASFDWLGLFRYSQEEGTPAFSSEAGVPHAQTEGRLRRLAELQEEIMRERARSLIGRRFQVLVEGRSLEAPGYWEARSWREAPEVDGVIFVHDHETLRPGVFYETIITGSEGIDLVGSLNIQNMGEGGGGGRE